MGTAIKHLVPDRVKPSFVIFGIRALWRSALSARVHRMLYSCADTATVGVKRSNSLCRIVFTYRQYHVPQLVSVSVSASVCWLSSRLLCVDNRSMSSSDMKITAVSTDGTCVKLLNTSNSDVRRHQLLATHLHVSWPHQYDTANRDTIRCDKKEINVDWTAECGQLSLPHV